MLYVNVYEIGVILWIKQQLQAVLIWIQCKLVKNQLTIILLQYIMIASGTDHITRYKGEKMKKIDKSSRIPLYYQLMNIIVEMIEEGNLQEDDKLPSERELCEKYDVSRSTVRQATGIRKEGYIYRVHGKVLCFSRDLNKIYGVLQFY